jgi:hypothetical protein
MGHNFTGKNVLSLYVGKYRKYFGYGSETDVSLDCGRFYGPFVRPRMRMSEGVNE